MKITKINLFEISIPFRFSFKHASHSRSVCHAILVQVTTDQGQSGWGEVHPRPYLTGETLTSCKDFLQIDAPKLIGGLNFDINTPPWKTLSAAFLQADKGRNLAAWSGIDLAITDAWSRQFKTPVSTFLAYGPRQNKPVNAITAPIGIAPVPIQIAMALGYRAAGFKQFKVKVATLKHIRKLSVVRRGIGADADLRIDVNGVWNLDTALDAISLLGKLNVSAIEQPLPAKAILEMAKLQNQTSIPLIADESYCSLQDATDLINANACKIWNFRLGKNGGFSGWAHHEPMARKNGIKLQLGTLVGEIGPLPAAAAILSQSYSFVFFEFGFPHILISKNPFSNAATLDFWEMKGISANAKTSNIDNTAGLSNPPDHFVLNSYVDFKDTIKL